MASGKPKRSRDSALLWNHQHGHWFDLVWLVYTVFFFIEPIQRHQRNYWLQFAAVYAVFLTLYVGIIRGGSRRVVYACMAAMTLLGLGYYPINQGASGIFIYVVAFAPFVTETVTASLLIFLGVAGSAAAEGILLQMSPWSWGFVLVFSIAVGSGNLVGAQRMRSNMKLSLAQEEIAHLAKMAERERIARDLHDVLGHTLSVVVLKSELAGKLMDDNPERSRREIGEVESIARTALAEVREAIRGYRSEGLVAEIDHARATLDAAGVTLECPPALPKLRPAEETVFSLIVREAVTNIVRHAQASQCRVRFEESDSAKSLVVEDDGRGGIRYEGNGLRGMRERAESLGGRLRIDSGTGTRLTIEIPA